MIVLSLWKGEIAAPDPRQTMREVAIEIATRHGLKLLELTGRCTLRPIAYARQEAMYEIRLRTGKSTTAIGRFFNRDHTTVLYGCAAHRERVT